MPRMTEIDLQSYLLKRRPKDSATPPPDAAQLEIRDIHEPFMQWLKEQRIPYIRARSDMESTIGVGIQDFTCFVAGRVVCIEAKRKGGKRTPQQLGWAMLMEKQGHAVHVVFSLEECKRLIETAKQTETETKITTK